MRAAEPSELIDMACHAAASQHAMCQLTRGKLWRPITIRSLSFPNSLRASSEIALRCPRDDTDRRSGEGRSLTIVGPTDSIAAVVDVSEREPESSLELYESRA